MKKYGLRIGNIGIEFLSIEDRDKAIRDFTRGSDVKISDSGIRYTEGNNSFSVYDRDTKEIITTCEVCKGTFSIETCSNHEYPRKNSWEKSYSDHEGYICDACFAKQVKAKEVFNAEQLIKSAKKDDD